MSHRPDRNHPCTYEPVVDLYLASAYVRDRETRVIYGRPWPTLRAGREALATVTIIAQGSVRGGGGRTGMRSGLELWGGSANACLPLPGATRK